MGRRGGGGGKETEALGLKGTPGVVVGGGVVLGSIDYARLVSLVAQARKGGLPNACEQWVLRAPAPASSASKHAPASTSRQASGQHCSLG